MHIDHYHNGKRLVSVTELQSLIDKPFLNKWRESLCECPAHKKGDGICGFVHANKVAKEAAELGNKVHKEVAAYLQVGSSAVLQPWSKAIIERLSEMHIEKHLIEPETVLVDKDSNLSGSPDFVGASEDQVFIGDLKIKNQLDILTALQGCGYRYLIKRLYQVDISTMVVLWAKKKSKTMEVEPVWYDLNEHMDTWHSLIKMWNYTHSNRQVAIKR